MCRVIIADDEPKVLLLIQKLIQWDELGLHLLGTAQDGVSALALIEAHRPDILITDIRMPGYDGIELIERAKEINPKIDCIIISGYRHFDYAQKAIRFGVEDYLLKPLKAVEINRTLRKMIENYREKQHAAQLEIKYSVHAENETKLRHERLLQSMLAERQITEQTTATKLTLNSLSAIEHEFGVLLHDDLFQAILIKADVHFASYNANVRKLLAEKCVSVASDALSAHCHLVLFYVAKQGVYALLNFNETQSKALRKALLAMIDALQSQTELFERIKVSVGLGRSTRQFSELLLAFDEAEAAVANRLVYGAGKIIDKTGELDVSSAVNRFINSEVRKQILQSIEVLDAEKAKRIIESLAQALMTQDGVNGKTILAVSAEYVHVLRFAMNSQHAPEAWIDAEEALVLERINLCASAQALFECLLNYATGLIAQVVERKKTESSKPIREAQKYIHEHYALAISLESISSQVGFNPSYFSSLFKKETGMNFLEYLTDIRIKEAKRLLADPKKNIADIAAEVGYSDIKHFSKLFTRLTGLQPSKYRKLYF